MRTVKLGLVGCGTVGGGLVKIIRTHHDDFVRDLGVDLVIEKATSRTLSKLSKAGIADEHIVESYEDILKDPEIDIVVELVGGTGFAAHVVLESLRAGKNVVTANKALMATRGKEIFEAAEAAGVEIAYEAAVGGGIPIIGPLKHSLTGNALSTVLGIVNGTTNYMLTRMADGLDYETALKEAQEYGYAEADPTADVDGLDAAAKIAILASIAFHTRVTMDQVYTEGIRGIEPVDFEVAESMGYAIKLLAIAHLTDGQVDVRVHPTLLPKTHQMARVDGVFNAIYVTGDAVGDAMFFGEGAGAGPAASAVAGDVIEVARHVQAGIPPLVGCTCTEERPLRPIGELETKFYIRLVVRDEPGVLADISAAFGTYGVSIRSMMQPTTDKKTVSIVFMTHQAKEADVQLAIERIELLPSVKRVGTIIRVEEE